MDFDETKSTYRDLIEKSVRFSGKDHDFFIKAKADLFAKVAKSTLPDISKPTVLDIGCGHGYMHPYLSRHFEVTGVEVASEVLTLAQKLNPDVKYLSYDGKKLPFADNAFDISMATCVMHHVMPEDWHNFMDEMKRVIKPGGMALVFEHNPYNPLTQIIVAKNPLDDDAVLLTNAKLKKLMHQSGLSRVSSKYFLFTPFASRIFRWLDEKIGWLPLGAQYYSLGRKQ